MVPLIFHRWSLRTWRPSPTASTHMGWRSRSHKRERRILKEVGNRTLFTKQQQTQQRNNNKMDHIIWQWARREYQQIHIWPEKNRMEESKNHGGWWISVCYAWTNPIDWMIWTAHSHKKIIIIITTIIACWFISRQSESCCPARTDTPLWVESGWWRWAPGYRRTVPDLLVPQCSGYTPGHRLWADRTPPHLQESVSECQECTGNTTLVSQLRLLINI